MSFQLDVPLVLALIVAFGLTVGLVKNHLSRQPLPPGPRGLPILGNALDMMGEHPWVKYTEWSKQYGEIMHISAAGQPIIILSTPHVLAELLDRRGSIYSDRPNLVMGGELAGYEDSVPMGRYGNRLRECRKLMIDTLTPRKAREYFPLEEEKTREFLGELLKSPQDFLHHIRRNIAAIVFDITHGHDLEDGEDTLLVLAERADADFSVTATPGAFMVDAFPVLKYLPRWLNLDWMQKEKIFRQNRDAFLNQPYNMVKEQVAQGIARPSFLSKILEKNPNPTPEQEDVWKWTSGGFYAGGADTSVSAIGSFFLAMSLYPEVQRKAQDEVRKVVGSSRLPLFSDRPYMPYVEALLNEVYRLNPVGPTALPHRSTQDDVYNGYFIPKGSIIFPNSWAVLHDPELYPDPFEFIPERYMDEDAKAKGLNPDPRKFAFGYGRRVCPGQQLADNSLFISITMVLSVFDISPEDPKAPRPDFSKSEGFTSSTISHPEPFKCKIIPSSPEAVSLIKANDPREH
ncbi:cytochrome P450 [Cylindrobasidium torrendii FP15055 ss-10]|uniref:Cytochrome P450 n=1 Tax=Cylindrobasidium torrendii FP15055 ss-10 TaxID=1314674 RepID=A0A0D7BKZ7_9AGAR|nr:cytochrome P450 [Cylindrobasidium torrendii FP15055 ss-10]